jgi:hypothetical protein
MSNSSREPNWSLEKEFEWYAAFVSIETSLVELRKLMNTEPKGISAVLNTLKNHPDLEKIQDIRFKEEIRNWIQGARELLLEIQESSLQTQEESIKLKTENELLKQELERIRANLLVKLVVKGGLYYTEDNDGPFCTACYDSKKEIIRLNALPGLRVHTCPICKANLNGGI